MQVNLKKLKPIGIIFILAFSLIAFIFCFKADMGIPPVYKAAHDWEYYQTSEQTLLELKQELENNVFQYFNSIQECVLDTENSKLLITLNDEKEFSKLNAVLNRDFNSELFQVILNTGN